MVPSVSRYQPPTGSTAILGLCTVDWGLMMQWGMPISRRRLAQGGAVVAAASVLKPSPDPVLTRSGATDGMTLAAAAVPAALGTPSSVAIQLNGSTGWYVPTDWGQNWRAKLNQAKAGRGLAVCAVLGDSVSFGYWASNLVSTSWPEILRKSLTALAGNGGSGFQSQAHSASVIYNPLSGVPSYYKNVTANVWQESAGWTPQVPPYVYGPGAGSLMCNISGATLANYIDGLQLGIWYYDGGAPFSVSIDGVSVGTVAVGTSYAPAHVTFTAPNNRFDVHYWSISGGYNSSSGLGTSICGVEGLGSNGVRMDNFSFPGLISRATANTDPPYYSGTYAGGWQNPADLIIYELGGNDIVGADPSYPSGTPADVWIQNIQSYLAGVMNNTYGGDARGSTDILFLFPVGNVTADRFRLFGEYKSRIIGLAQSYGAAVLDVGALFHGSWNAWAKMGYAGNQADPTNAGTDFNHPSDAGHSFVAAQLTPLLTALS